jgi:cytoskeletal protein RodZ
MESKSRRTVRAAGRTEAPSEPIKAIEVPGARDFRTEAATEPSQSTEAVVAAAEPVETALGPMTTATTPVEASAEPPAMTTSPTRGDPDGIGHDAFTALAQSQAAVARGLEALSAEMAGLALSGIDTAARTATKMLGVKTLSDAIEVNAGFTCSSWDRLIGSSAKLSELGVKLAAEASQPFVTQFAIGWGKTRP